VGKLAWIRLGAFGITENEATFARRGFPAGDARIRFHLEAIGRTFIRGYRAALEAGRPERLGPALEAVDPKSRGFAYEGAAMAFELLDRLWPGRGGRVQSFLEGTHYDHVYMIHVGVGWALARLGLDVTRSLTRLDPLLGWLAVDGYGFHEGYFHWRRVVDGQAVPGRLRGYARRAFDQGLGRSLWFVEGADVERIGRRVASFATERRADLWSGVGLACAYAGGADREAVERLASLAGPERASMAQGAAFAAKARQRAGNPTEQTEMACRVLCGRNADEAAEATDQALENLPPDGEAPAFELWRRRIRARLAEEVIPS